MPVCPPKNSLQSPLWYNGFVYGWESDAYGAKKRTEEGTKGLCRLWPRRAPGLEARGAKDRVQPLLDGDHGLSGRGVLGTEFTGSLESLHFTRQKWDVISNFLASFGRPGAEANSRGVFAIAVNKIADGSLHNIVNNTIMSLAGSSEFWQSFGIVVSSLVSMTYWVLVTHTFVVILRRLFMEMRVYEEVPPYRALYLHSARCWGRTSLALRVAIQRGLWVADDHRRRNQDVFVLSLRLHSGGEPDHEGRGRVRCPEKMMNATSGSAS